MLLTLMTGYVGLGPTIGHDHRRPNEQATRSFDRRSTVSDNASPLNSTVNSWLSGSNNQAIRSLKSEFWMRCKTSFVRRPVANNKKSNQRQD